MPWDYNSSERHGERGVTILLVVVALVVVLGMAALAIDVVTLYVARAEAQRAADAAALAGAKTFVTTGFTSSLPGFALADLCTTVAGSGGSGAANLQAQAAAAQNLIAGVPANVTSISCNLTNVENPQITVTVQRTNLPTFFARIWGSSGNSVRASATAEAYNPSASSSAVPVSVAFVKPFLIANCAPGTAPGAGCTSGYFIRTSDYALNNPSAYIGQALPFTPSTQPASGQYYVVNLLPATVCPGASALPSGSCNLVGGGGLYDNIACANVNQLSCGQTVTVNSHSADSTLLADTAGGAQCLIHASSIPATGPVPCLNPNLNDQDCFLPGPPITINGGISNPNPAFRAPAPTAVNISRSDSVVTVPLYDGLTDLCQGGVCNQSAQIVGFLQLGVQDVRSDGTIDAVVLNGAGCDPSGSGTAVVGGAVTPIPVRLIHN
jgi:hypothetical protein